jgi:small ligand-binding sensory domain FIST
MKFISVTSHQRHSLGAAREIVAALEKHLEDDGLSPDLLLLFATQDHARRVREIGDLLRETWPQAFLLGATAAGIIHSAGRSVDRGAMTVMAGSLPGVKIAPVLMELEDFAEAQPGLEQWRDLLELLPDPQLMILLADPFSTPVADLLESLNMLAPGVPVIGGLASGGRRPGFNVLLLNDTVRRSGLVGAAFGGNIRADVVVSQGCRPVGRTFTVTKSDRNIIQELSGMPAMRALQDMVSALSSEEQHLLQEGLMFGQAVRDPSERFGRGDFLIRPVVAVDQKDGTISLAGEVGVGKTIRFHAWDDTLADDLQMLLLPQILDSPAAGGFLVGSWPRVGAGEGLPIQQIIRTLGYRVPMAGLLSAGEIGPIRGANYLHMHTATLALLRPAAPMPQDRRTLDARKNVG